MNELMEILRGMRMDADQAIQLLTSDRHDVENAPVILNRMNALRDQIDGLIKEYGDYREERA